VGFKDFMRTMEVYMYKLKSWWQRRYSSSDKQPPEFQAIFDRATGGNAAVCSIHTAIPELSVLKASDPISARKDEPKPQNGIYGGQGMGQRVKVTTWTVSAGVPHTFVKT